MQFLSGYINPKGVSAFVTHQNLALVNRPPLVVENADPALVGSSFGYMFRWQMNALNPDRSIAVEGARKLNAEKVARRMITDGNKQPELRPSYAVALGLFEGAYRHNIHPWLAAWQSTEFSHLLPSMEDESIKLSMLDVSRLAETITGVWHGIRGAFVDHPTFDGSPDVGGADAQAIMGDMLIDVRCSRKREPFSMSDLYQQFMYCVLDYSDQYKLKRIGWYFVRQQALLVVPLDRIVRDMEKARKDWQAFLRPRIGEGVFAEYALAKLADKLGLPVPEDY